MAVDEVRLRLRRKLEEAFGVEEAALLMDRPPGGWGDLATRRDLEALEVRFDLKLDALEHKLIATMEAGFRSQTWRLITTLIAAMGVQTAVMAALITVARV